MLLDREIPKSDIVLGFQAPIMRQVRNLLWGRADLIAYWPQQSAIDKIKLYQKAINEIFKDTAHKSTCYVLKEFLDSLPPNVETLQTIRVTSSAQTFEVAYNDSSCSSAIRAIIL